MATLGDTNNVDIHIKTTADTSGAKDTEKALHDVGAKAETSSISFGKMTAAVAVGQAAFNITKDAIGSVIGFLGSSVKSANDSENAIAQLVATLKSTHSAAGLTNDELVNMASALQKVTTFSDEAVLGAENLLLTFTNVKGQVFKDSVPLILDMSQALGQDLKSSSIQLGKALNDPIKGITALSRVGVSFTSQQKDQISAMVSAGKTADAQRVILKELTTEFGGSAKAAGKTFAGSLAILKNQMDDVKESIGGAIVKGITPFISKAAEFASSVDWEKVIGRSTDALKNAYKWMKDFIKPIVEVAKQIDEYLEPKVKDLVDTVKDAYAPIRKFYDEYLSNLVNILAVTADKNLVWAIGMAIDIMKDIIKVGTTVFSFLDENKAVVLALAGAFGTLALSMALTSAFNAITIGFATLQLVTIPSLMTSLGLLRIAFISAFPMAAIAVEAVAAFEWIMQRANQTKAVLDKTNAAIDAAYSSDSKAILEARKLRATGKPEDLAKAKNIEMSITGRATGGPVSAGQSYIVGEKGQELFTPSQNGYITPADKTASMMGGNTTNIYGNITLSSPEAVTAFFKRIGQDQLLAQRGMTPVRAN